MSAIEEEKVVPTFRAGDRLSGDMLGIVRRTDWTGGGSQTIWTNACPGWCTGHNPDEQVEDIAAYDWTEHHGPDEGLRLPGLSDSSGKSYRESGIFWLESRQVRGFAGGSELPLIQLGQGRSSVEITPPEARSLAALLVRFADVMEA